ncbi:Hypp9729 [Branchiostoma lanceolatum]|uniref:Hypp9729 protein n=1 Tax=Branchiostoma lanceolatum TaxID=7740 RepID=A0A8S4MP52_BRALA|nr:Hypp9729 [Branchiostoma lanceolatum]
MERYTVVYTSTERRRAFVEWCSHVNPEDVYFADETHRAHEGHVLPQVAFHNPGQKWSALATWYGIALLAEFRGIAPGRWELAPPTNKVDNTLASVKLRATGGKCSASVPRGDATSASEPRGDATSASDPRVDARGSRINPGGNPVVPTEFFWVLPYSPGLT